jgi:hypothetical protein
MSGEWNAPFRALPEDRGRWPVSVLARQARVMHPGDHAVIQLADTSDFVRQGRVLCGHRLANAALTTLTGTHLSGIGASDWHRSQRSYAGQDGHQPSRHSGYRRYSWHP